jgi:hypothetical protein
MIWGSVTRAPHRRASISRRNDKGQIRRVSSTGSCEDAAAAGVGGLAAAAAAAAEGAGGGEPSSNSAGNSVDENDEVSPL